MAFIIKLFTFSDVDVVGSDIVGACTQVVAAGGVAQWVCAWRGGGGGARVRWAGGGRALPGGATLSLGPVTRALQGLYQCFVERDDDNAQAVAELRLGGESHGYYVR